VIVGAAEKDVAGAFAAGLGQGVPVRTVNDGPFDDAPPGIAADALADAVTRLLAGRCD
jgi:hypothetical protein